MPFRLRLGPLFAMMAAPALLATIAASYVAFWFYAASHLKERTAQWAEARRAEGYTVSYVMDGTGGFPLDLSVTLKAVSVKKDDGGEIAFSAPVLTLGGGIFSPRHVTVALPKGAQIAVTQDGRTTRLGKTDGTARLALVFDAADALREATFVAQKLSLAGEWKGAPLASPLVVGEAQAALTLAAPTAPTSPDAEAPAAARFDLSIRDLRWPDGTVRALGPDLAGFDFSAKLAGPMPRGETEDALAQWRDAGGRIEVDRIALKWDNASFAGYGTLVLDDALQPAVSLTARVESFIPLVDVLDETGLIRSSDATLARLVIGRQMPQSGAGNLSLSLHGGVVYAGPLALLHVPAVSWPPDPDAKSAKAHLTPSGRPLMQPGVDIGKDGVVRQK